ncbi:ABC transporter substrate-binding protein [Candidatus Margulisiibacteriota bacterium]
MRNKFVLLLIILMLLPSNALCMGNGEKPQGSEIIKTTEAGETVTAGKPGKKDYDGVWFLGFNLKKRLFSGVDGRVVRQAFSMAVNRKVIAQIIGDDIIPGGVIPPGMEGYDPTIKGYPYDIKLAKRMMRSSGYPLNDKRIKGLTILHTDGAKTRRIVDRIKMDLIDIGVDMKRTVVKYTDQATWKRLLASGKYDLFVMGYKAGSFGELFIGDKDSMIFHSFTCHLNPTDEARQKLFDRYEDAVKLGYSPCQVCKPKYNKIPDPLALLEPLFHSGGETNFTFYSNKRVDALMDRLVTTSKRKKFARYEILHEIDRTILDDCPVLSLFYITKL